MARPRKTVLFNGRRFNIRNISDLRRHSNRYRMKNHADFEGAKLTPKGKTNASKVGREIPKNMRLSVYYSYPERTRESALLIQKAHKEGRGKARKAHKGGKAIRERNVLSPELIRDQKKVFEIMKRVGKGKVIEYWLEGNIPQEVCATPKEVAERIIKNRFGLVKRAERTRNIHGEYLLNNTHDYMVVAVLERLLGKKASRELGNPNPNQGLKIYHTAEGKDILEYKRRRFDVTEKLKEILN